MTTQPYGAPTHLRVPTIVLHGTPDRLILVDNGRRLAGLINASRYAELPTRRGSLRLLNTPTKWRR